MEEAGEAVRNRTAYAPIWVDSAAYSRIHPDRRIGSAVADCLASLFHLLSGDIRGVASLDEIIQRGGLDDPRLTALVALRPSPDSLP
jgi:hypothetical protein